MKTRTRHMATTTTTGTPVAVGRPVAARPTTVQGVNSFK